MALPKCLVCNQQLSKYSAKRCKPHAKAGVLNQNWKGGKPNCLDCDKKIDRRAKRCKSCTQKKRDPQTRVILKGEDSWMFGKYGWKSYIFIKDSLDEQEILRKVSK